MTNQMIILTESIRLMKEGILKGSGEFVEVERPDGTMEKLEMPEPIHTYNGWKERGYIVKKGEHSSIRFPIWKYSTKKIEKNGEEVEKSRMFAKVSSFFTFDQVEKIEARA